LNDGGAKYAAFVEQELRAERDRRSSLDARAQSFVTASGTLVTLSAAIGAFVSSRKDYVVPSVAQFPLIITVTLFTITLILAILATFNFAYQVADRRTLEGMPRDHWNDEEGTALRNVVALNVTTVLTLRHGNNQKVAFLLAALVAQLIALTSLGLTVYLMVINV
jgi:hypothetical protein